ncbi:MAG: cofactor-independent phosphoglycerate mutase [Pirellulaceae bacterium]|nr:MAG: cofactor-independent phosphoglycerate mutase [Pirellulaceae bacterium]
MKYAIVIPDGCADEPLEMLGGRTPLEAARTPAMDEIARAGRVGRAQHVPAHLPPGSDVANLSLLGYDPNRFFTGRAPLEAAAQGIELGPADWAIRCNLVTIQDQTMRDFTAGHISTEEARQLLDALQRALPAGQAERWQFVAGVSYRNLLIYRGAGQAPLFSRDTRTTPPHDLTDKSVEDDYPRGPGSNVLTEWMELSERVFASHPVNQQRRQAAKSPATHVWLWGLGQAPALEPFIERFGVRGAMITAVDLLRGLAKLVGWRIIEVPGATGYLDTDYAAKGRYAVQALDDVDLVCVHIEATDEASHEGRAEAKIEALEQIDRKIVAPLWEALPKHGAYRMLICPDHPTPIRLKTHSHGWVPFAMAGTGIRPDGATAYSETAAAATGWDVPEGWRLMESFLDERQ